MVGRGRSALTACGTRREPVLGGRWRDIHAAYGPAIGEDHRTRRSVGCLLKAINTDHLRWPLPAHRRGTLRGMDAA
ncbi:hypothetical protein EIQ10_21365 [Xanthomonas campestris pv. campestris]